MATYVIGDIQGCFKTMQKLLAMIMFDENRDQIILLGDVVNRGPNSLLVLRYIIEHEKSIKMVLGNHDILAIALFLEVIDRPHTMQALLNAPDAKELINWLRHQPLIIQKDDALFMHAGILPSVSSEEALIEARRAEERLRGLHTPTFLVEFYERRFGVLKDKKSEDRSIEALCYLTLIRMCANNNTMESYSGDLAQAPKDLKPWFMLRDQHKDPKIYFGHWAALGLYQYKNYYCLDSGCVWGNKLTALRLEDGKLFQADNCE